MWQTLAVGTDLLHAILMGAWVAGLPLLVWQHRWPRVARLYALYAIAFIVASQLSQWFLGECFLTSIALFLWERVPSSAPVSKEWFTVRIAQAVFHMAPSHRSIVLASEAMIVATALAALWSFHRLRGVLNSRTRRSPTTLALVPAKADRRGDHPSPEGGTPRG
jgi:hypothetical protein